MRVSFIAFAVTAAVATTSLLNAQTNSQDFPWRTSSGVQPVVHPDLRTGNVSPGLTTQTQITPRTQAQFEIEPADDVRMAQNTMPRVQTDTMPRVQTDTTIMPASPTKRPRGFLAEFINRQEQDLGDAQPSVSDLIQEEVTPAVSQNIDPGVRPQLADPQAAPVAQSVLQPSGVSTEPAVEPITSVVSNATPDETDYCARNCKRDFCNLGCERKLFGTTPRGLEIGGWLAVGYHNRDTIMFNNRKGEANLDQAWLYFDKAASQDCPNWDFGYRVDMVYGIDAQDTQAFGNPPAGAPTGWDNSWDYGSYGWALPQAYLQMANENWDVKLGKFFSPFGYEKIQAPENFFYSHSYTRYFVEPFTMSGILAERKMTDTRSMLLGATAGWNTGFDNDTGGCLITGNRIQLNEFVNLALTTCWGDRGRRGVGALNTGVAQVQLSEDLKYVFQGDFSNFGTNNEFGIVQYMFRDLSECVALGARLEWWKSDQLYTDTKSTYEFTMGANLRPTANLVIRPEVRWDWGAAAIDPGEAIIGLDIVATY